TENRQQILLSKQLVTIDTSVPLDLDWDEFKVRPPDRATLMPLLKELEFTNLIKEYLPPDSGPAIEIVQTDTPPVISETVILDVQTDRVSFWPGDGAVFSVPLNAAATEVLSNPAVRKITYNLKDAMLKLGRRGLDIAPPYDDPMLMTYLL